MAEGWSRQKAYDEAKRLFGNLTLTTERTRDVHVSAWADTILQDIQYALRRLLFVGSAAALLLMRLLGNQVYGVDISDPATYGFVACCSSRWEYWRLLFRLCARVA
jgi:hypothetical protein